MTRVKVLLGAGIGTVFGFLMSGCASNSDIQALREEVQNAQIMANAARLQAQGNAEKLEAIEASMKK